MEIKDFINKVVIYPKNNRRYLLYRITSPFITVASAQPDAGGHFSMYRIPTINGDPISTGELYFEDPSLKEPFLAAYGNYCRTEDAYWEEFEYWMRRD
ncbi:MAG: hypothetical protein IJD22_02800 [Clostridia bacterium]|nr:hypothetical protein [Clostridia bacterium]